MIFSRYKAKLENIRDSIEKSSKKSWEGVRSELAPSKTKPLTESLLKESWQLESSTHEVSTQGQTISLTTEQILDEQQLKPTVKKLQKERVLPCDMNISAEEDIKRRFGSNVKSALGHGTMIEGTFRFDTPVCIDGTLLGEVVSSSVLIVGTQASVRAKVKVGSIVVLGSVIGDVEADELIEIRCGGQIAGDIITKRLAIEEGGFFEGACYSVQG